MADHEPPTPETRPEPGHEAAGLDLRWIMTWLGILVAMVMAVLLFLSWHLARLTRSRSLADREAARREAVPGVRQTRAATEFPAPRLQVSPPLDLRQLRAREDAELTNFGWLDRTNGVVRLPIERAMEIIAQKGLPTGTNAGATGPSSLQLLQQRRGQFVPPQTQPQPQPQPKR